MNEQARRAVEREAPGPRPSVTFERWMVVREDAKLPGGYRVVTAGLREDEAHRWAADYTRPHMAMSERRLRELRMDALAE